MEAATATNTGRVEQIQGVVIEAVFPDKLPEINHAIETTLPDDSTLVLEVQQHLGDDRVRAVAMDSTDGLARGVEVRDLGGPISVPVGKAVLGQTIGCARCKCVKLGIGDVPCSSAIFTNARCKSATFPTIPPIASRHHNRMSSATWSFRDRAVCNLRPGSPIRSISAASTAM